MKKIILLLMMAIVLASSANAAHFVCGKVNDAIDGTSPAWRIAYVSLTNRSDRAECEISSAEQKYCCDLEDLAKAWAIGNNIYAWIPDDSSGYLAYESSSIATGAGYDVMPDMDLTGLIMITGINSYYTVDHVSGNILTTGPYTSEIGYSLNGEPRVVLCTSCSSVSVSLTNLSNDDYTISAYAKDSFGNEKTNSRLFTVDVPPPATTTTTTTLSTTTTTLAGTEGQSLTGQFRRSGMKAGCKASFTSIVAGKTYTFITDDCDPLVSIDFIASNQVSHANINVNVIESNGSLNIEGFSLYSTVDIVTDMKKEDIAKVTYKIKIDKEWMKSHNADIMQIAVLNNNGESLQIFGIEDLGDYYHITLLSNNIESLIIISEKGAAIPPEPYTETNVTPKERIKTLAPGKIPGGELLRRAVMKQFYNEIIIFLAVVFITSLIFILARRNHKKRKKEKETIKMRKPHPHAKKSKLKLKSKMAKEKKQKKVRR